jgi:hypothetical protein
VKKKPLLSATSPDIAETLKAYPFVEKEKAWYFNNTLDRQIAELRGDRVYANPRLLWKHFSDNQGNTP